MYYLKLAEACVLGMPGKNCWKYFKKQSVELPRIIKVLGILKSIAPKEILDVGPGRGRALWPMVYNLPDTSFVCVDEVLWRTEVINAVHLGGS